MKKEFILNLAKVLGVMYIMFISLFALDSWGQWPGFFMHLIPSFITIAVLLIAWNKQLMGGILFFILAISTILYFNTYKQTNIFLLISFPLIVIGLLFVIYNYIKEK